MRLSRIILLFLIGVFLAHIAFYYVNLPETMASHFDGAGNPNGWMSKQGYVVFEIALLIFIIGQFLLVPLLIEKTPRALINLPNKDYWLADERRTETFAIFRNYFEWFCAALLMLVIAVNQLVFRANINHENLSDKPMWIIIITFVLYTFVWLISLVRKFTKPLEKL